MSWWKNLQDTLHPPPHPRAKTRSSPPSAAVSEHKQVPPWAPKRIPNTPGKRRRSNYASLHLFIYRYFSFILLFLFFTSLTAIYIAIRDMSAAPRKLRVAHEYELFGGGSGQRGVWTRFSMLEKYYGGLFSLVPKKDNVPDYPPRLALEKAKTAKGGDALGVLAKSMAFEAYPDYASEAYTKKWRGVYQKCSFGETKEGRVREVPEVRVFDGVPAGMPEPLFGSYEELGLKEDVCFDRLGRLGAYGYGYAEEEGGLKEAMFSGGGESEHDIETGRSVGSFPLQKIDWRGVDWGHLQLQCLERNKARFEGEDEDLPAAGDGSERVPRTAVVLRTYSGYHYTANDIANMRSMISELSIKTGGEYTVHILLHIKNSSKPIWSSQVAYNEVLAESGLPQEFHSITQLWNEPQMAAYYTELIDTSNSYKNASLPPDLGFQRLPLHGVYRSGFMPIQWFSQEHPEYDFIWNFEMDFRYTGHYYHLLSQLSSWADSQPLAGLWERNARFYLPELHGDYATFSEMASPESAGNTTGVGEAADLITLNPLFDPSHTPWILRHDYTGFTTPPVRRTAIIATARLSRRMLSSMHDLNRSGKTLFTEMLPGSVALQKGYKAVFVPHPMFADRRWPIGFLAKTFDGVDKVLKWENVYYGISWYYNSGFAGKLYKRWLGIRREQTEGMAVGDRERARGRMCLGGMLLHPVKDVEEKPNYN